MNLTVERRRMNEFRGDSGGASVRDLQYLKAEDARAASSFEARA